MSGMTARCSLRVGHCFLGQLSALRRPRHFFPGASFSKSACMFKSAYIRFNRGSLPQEPSSLLDHLADEILLLKTLIHGEITRSEDEADHLISG